MKNISFKQLFLLVAILCAVNPAYAQGPFAAGERVAFSIKKLAVKAGEASLVFNGLAEWHGRELLSISFKATSVNFLDEEEIYCDPKTFLPILVIRNVNIWGKKESIKEEYDPAQGTVVITKKAGGKVTKNVISKGRPLENIYCFLYRYRQEGQFKVGETMALNLPTADIVLKVVSMDKVKAGGRVYDAYYLESRSGEYRLWFGGDSHRTPLRIDGAVKLGSAALIMKEYRP